MALHSRARHKAKEPSKAALNLAAQMAKAFDALQSDWTAVVIVLRKAKL